MRYFACPGDSVWVLTIRKEKQLKLIAASDSSGSAVVACGGWFRPLADWLPECLWMPPACSGPAVVERMLENLARDRVDERARQRIEGSP